ncbi:pimeloyl-ACP methyl ester carboxylesterase [Roseibium hamelinense]|uniref:Pimeloyl-ACP methyl ester carboxylesterase n=1 Tax=Roseibium hamelinense TaxID=150831 RepID=A0A562SF33_9HYPH|nr:pimeloyl-ACP methyl ester carboxylesterase [Roseibium hamelinense]
MPNAPIVLLHGTNAAPWTMQTFTRFFEQQGYSCHTPTYRHHDLPASDERQTALTGLSIADYVSDISAFISGLEQPPIVIGHSLGGLIAQLLAARGEIRAAVLINSSICHGTLPTTDMERALGKGFMSAGRFWEMAPGQDFELLAAYGLNTMPEHQQHAICDRLGTESGTVLFELFFWMYDINQTTWIDHATVQTPLLFLSGTEDKVVPPSTSRAMASRYGDWARFVEVEGKCHYMQLEDGWQDIAQTSLDWISALPETS